MRIVCLSFDDGTIYDKRFIELLNKYNLKATLNLNSGLKDFVWYFGNRPVKRLDLKENKAIYNGHEVASHSVTHPYFSGLDKDSVIKEVKDDVATLNQIFDGRVSGFAFPFHDQTEEHINIIKDNIPLDYIRYSYLTNDYMPKDRYHIPIHAIYNDKDIYERLEVFSKNNLENSLFLIAGHAYEFEMRNDWDTIENLLKYLKNNKDITVLTVHDAVKVLFGDK